MSDESGPASLPSIEGFTDLVKIGQGGFSTVYAATQDGIERRVAIKVLDLGFSDQHRFRRECRTLGSLSGVHGIVPVLQATFTSTGQPCIVMQLMSGGSLSQLVRSTGPLPPIDVIGNGAVLCAALQEAHDRRIFHRDIKPENVLFSGNDAAIADFGIALVDDVESRSQTMDSISPPHAPPERFADGRADPVLGDIYSLGSTLYTALAGRPPFGTAAEGGLAGLIQRVTSSPVPPVDRPDAPTELIGVLERAMAKQPLDRYQSMASFGAAIAGVSAAQNPIDLTVRRSPGARRAVPAAPPGPPTSARQALIVGPPALDPIDPTIHRAPASAADAPDTPPAAAPTIDMGNGASTRRTLATALWSVAAVLLVLSLAGGAYLLGQQGTERAAAGTTDSERASSTVPPTTTNSTAPTVAPTTTPSLSTTSAPPPSTTLMQPPTTSPTPTQPPLPESEATTAVAQYLEAASGFDVDAFAARWAYPVELQYTKRNVSEQALRESAINYFASKADLDFVPTGPTTVAASDRGWETTTQYRAEQWPIEGGYKCEVATIRLGFDASWRVRTATESSQGSC